jgi:hypothetical protein
VKAPAFAAGRVAEASVAKVVFIGRIIPANEVFDTKNSDYLLYNFHLKEKDPGFGGLVRVMNKRQEFLWVHERFSGEY